MEQQSSITVRNNSDRQRYELLDGDSVIGTAYWVQHEGRRGTERIFYHTVVDDAYAGEGLASRLARYALDDTIEAGLPIIPVCSYIKSWLQKHSDYQEHAMPVLPEHLEAIHRSKKQ